VLLLTSGRLLICKPLSVFPGVEWPLAEVLGVLGLVVE
jgi:hypothetical protein